VFGLYPPCVAINGLVCFGGGVITCCDDIPSSHFMGCHMNPGAPNGSWAGPYTCASIHGPAAWCVALSTGADYCAAGVPVLVSVVIN
jgi:hypothetical protein